jgi:hypothetical protein
MNRVCPNCYRKEELRVNFGNDREAEAMFHQQKWCSCGYQSPQEMMRDQDLGFEDPRWVPIARYFLNEYYLRLKQGEINNKDEHVRFFLKLLKSAANNRRLSIELVNRKDNEEWKFVYDGKSKNNPRKNIFDSSYDLENVPPKVIFDTLNKDQTIVQLNKEGIKKNRWIAVLIILIVVLSVRSIFL